MNDTMLHMMLSPFRFRIVNGSAAAVSLRGNFTKYVDSPLVASVRTNFMVRIDGAISTSEWTLLEAGCAVELEHLVPVTTPAVQLLAHPTVDGTRMLIVKVLASIAATDIDPASL